MCGNCYGVFFVPAIFVLATFVILLESKINLRYITAKERMVFAWNLNSNLSLILPCSAPDCWFNFLHRLRSLYCKNLQLQYYKLVSYNISYIHQVLQMTITSEYYIVSGPNWNGVQDMKFSSNFGFLCIQVLKTSRLLLRLLPDLSYMM